MKKKERERGEKGNDRMDGSFCRIATVCIIYCKHKHMFPTSIYVANN